MKRIIAAVLLAVFTVTSFAASLPNDQYRNTAGESDQHTEVGG
jgi:hypothetical protein